MKVYEIPEGSKDSKGRAIQNLIQNGLNPEMSYALSLATQNPDMYKGQIESLFNYQNQNALVKQNIADAGVKETAIEEAVNTLFIDSEHETVMRYKHGQGNADKTRVAIQAAAKGYLASNRSATPEQAAEFAMKPIMEEYGIGSVRGVPIAVPIGANADKTGDRLEEYFKREVEPMMGKNFKTGLVRPILNDEENGYYFIYDSGEPVTFPNSREPVTISFDRLIEFDQTPNAFELRGKNTATTGVQSGVTPPNQRGVK
jgi:hypothetical protein